MASNNNHPFLKADISVGLVSLCVAAAVCFSLTREQGCFSPSPPVVASTPNSQLVGPSTNKDQRKTLDNPSQPANVSKAAHLFDQAGAEEKAGQRRAAIDHYKEACKLDPIRKFYWSSLGGVSLLSNAYSDAYTAFMEVYNRDCYDVFNLTNLGFVSQSLRRDDDARRFYLMALTIQPDSQISWDEIYSLSHGAELGRFSDEIRQAAQFPVASENPNLVYKLNQAMLDDHPTDYYLIVNRALMNIRCMRLDRVQGDIDKALRINKLGPAALLAQAQFYNFSGETDKASKAYRDCLAVSPQPIAYAELGAIEMQTGLLDLALHDYAKATELGNDKPSWAMTLAKLREQRDQRDRLATESNKTHEGDKAVAAVRGSAVGAPNFSGRGAFDAK